MRTNKYLEAIKDYISSKDMSYCNCGKPNQVGGFSCKQHCKHGQAKELSKDVFDNPGEAMERAKQMGLDNIHSVKTKDGKNVFMPGKTHEEYLSKLNTKALQYGKPGPNDPRKTPAPKKDQKKGSKKNKPDSAKDDKGKITLDDSVIKRLQALVTEHNKKDKGSKATLGMLKAVYRRGAGAFSTSHHPNMSRDGWAIARVNAFLYLLRNGRPSNPNYKQDNDLLPKNHPRSTK
jgi:hypothetical protein